MEIHYYVDARGKTPFLDRLKSFDYSIRARILRARLRWESGNLGHIRALGAGIYESKMDYGGGLRVYFGRDGERVILLLLCGNKATQSKDIFLSKQYWVDYTKGAKNAKEIG